MRREKRKSKEESLPPYAHAWGLRRKIKEEGGCGGREKFQKESIGESERASLFFFFSFFLLILICKKTPRRSKKIHKININFIHNKNKIIFLMNQCH